MMPYWRYQLWEIERTKSAAEQRAADARTGEFAAAMARSFRQAGRQLRAGADLGARLRRSSAPVGARAAAQLRVPG